MNARAAVDRRIYEARMRFRYKADHRREADWIEQITADYFPTPAEMEAKGADDCDGFAVAMGRWFFPWLLIVQALLVVYHLVPRAH